MAWKLAYLPPESFNAILKDVYTANPTVHGYVACTDSGINFVGPDEKIEPDDENILSRDGSESTAGSSFGATLMP